MADLTDIQSSLAVKIAGANPASGVEDNFLDVDSTGRTTVKLNDGSGTSITVGQKVSASSVPVVISSDQSAISVTHTEDKNFGVVGATTLRTAAELGNATGAADFNLGAASAQTLRVAPVSSGTTGSSVPAAANLMGGKNTSGNLQAASINRDGQLNVSTGTDKSVFGPAIVASRVQQISADFSESLVNNNLTQTTTGTGTVSLLSANASISTGTGVTSSAQITSIGAIDYLPGREMYAQYTAAFTTPTSAASTQLTGLYNGTDGLLIGYNGLNFSIGTVAGGASTFVASSSFNVDTLTGAANSQFTRAGVPEAVNFTFKNVYRIRAGWLGAAPIFFEIMSPDGNWVTFHIVRQPNSSLNPSFLEPSLPFTMLVTKTSSDATNLKITTTSWDAGVVDLSGQTDTSDSGTIAALNGAVTISIQSQSTVVANVTGTWVGTIQVQGDVGDGTWNSIYAINTNAVASQTITANATLIIACAGFTSVRLIGTAWTSGTANVNWVASSGTQAIIAQVVGNIASGSADTGNPIKVGGVYNTTLPVVTTGQRVDLQLDQNGRLLTSTAVTSSLPAATFSSQHVITNGTTFYTAFTAAQKLALKQFYAGGTGIGKQALYSYNAAASAFVNGGDFENAGDVGTTWLWASAGGTGSIAQSSLQAQTGTKSCQLTFSNSSGTNAQQVKQTYITPVDYTGYRYVQAYFYNTLSTGGTYTRTISVILTDSNAVTRTYSVSGVSTSAPFNSSGWIQILGELSNPTSQSASSFDQTSIASITLQMSDSGNKSGIVYWDSVKLISTISPIFPIYHYQNTSFNINIDPVFVMNIGDQILIAQTNNDTSKQEYFALAGGVSI